MGLEENPEQRPCRPGVEAGRFVGQDHADGVLVLLGVRRFACGPGLTWACYRTAGFAICEPLSRLFSRSGG